jgi:hypothetical protein
MWNMLGRGAYGFLVAKPEGKGHVEDRAIDEKEALKLILKKSVGRVWIGLIC